MQIILPRFYSFLDSRNHNPAADAFSALLREEYYEDFQELILIRHDPRGGKRTNYFFGRAASLQNVLVS